MAEKIQSEVVTNHESIRTGSSVDALKRAKLSSKTIIVDVTAEWLVLNTDEQASVDSLFGFRDSVPLSDSKIKPVQIGVNVDYLLPLLEHAGTDTVTIRIGGPLDPIMVEAGEYMGIIMPYRI